MPKKFIKRYTPDKETIRNHKYLQIFGRLLHDPNLWHMNRRSVSGAFAVGLFWAFIPIPFQMITAAATAIPARVNLPISVALVWITNPLTMPPMFYSTYVVGTWIMGDPPQQIEFEMTTEWLKNSVGGVWEPLYIGSFLCACIASLIGYIAMRGIWRWHVINHLKRRKKKWAKVHAAEAAGHPGNK
jgi:uncharacterized protein (DUF2062 family)